MQTFLPDPDLRRCARLLDDRRLGKQRVETFQILRALTWRSYGWKNHPAVVMWRGHVPALVLYGLVVCDEWRRRGYADTVAASLLAFTGGRTPRWRDLLARGALPPWLGDPVLHASHRAALLRKDPVHYEALHPGAHVDEDLTADYVWPGSVWPRWPVPPLRRRPGRSPAADAAALLGVPATPAVLDAVRGLVAGDDVDLVCRTPQDARTAGLVAAVAVGATAWLHEGPALPVREPLPRRAAATVPDPAAGATGGAGAVGTARPPTPEDVAQVARAARTRPVVSFLRPQQRVGPDGGPSAPLRTARLVVVDPGSAHCPDGPAAGPRTGAPVLRLVVPPGVNDPAAG